MWQDSANGISAEFPAKNGVMFTVELNRKREVATINDGVERVIMGMRDNKVRIYNDLIFDANVNNSIKARMGQLFIKKVDPKANKRR